MNLIAVPEDGTSLDVLALRYRAAFDKTKAGRSQWVEGTLELAIVIAEAREELPDHNGFSRWLGRHGLEPLHPNERTALYGFSQDTQAARKLLEQSNSTSWRVIWESRPNKPLRPLTKIDKGAPRPFSRGSGASDRKRARRIPTVMQDDPPPPPPERKAAVVRALTREQVDPDFKGDAIEFATKYGHVTLHTKAEIKHHKHQEALSAWLGAMADHERSGREMVTALAAVDPETLREWLAKPGKAGKLQAWCNSITLACEKLRHINKTETAT